MLLKRILLKFSGEVLEGKKEFGYDTELVRRFALSISNVVKKGIGISLVIGGGNIFRGKELTENTGISSVSADHIGMLATIMNALFVQSVLEKHDLDVRVMSAIDIDKLCEPFIYRRAMRHLEKKRVIIFAAGTGNPTFTTDSAASLRAIEIGADAVFKATKVDGVYDKDPEKSHDAKRYEKLSYNEVLSSNLQVMDATSIALCRDHDMPIFVFNVLRKNSLLRVMEKDYSFGTWIKG